MAKKLNKEEVEKIAELARLSLTDKEVKEAEAYMSDILGYVSLLDSVKTDSVESYAPAGAHIEDLREDTAETFADREGLLPKDKFNKDDLLKTQGVFGKKDE